MTDASSADVDQAIEEAKTEGNPAVKLNIVQRVQFSIPDVTRLKALD